MKKLITLLLAIALSLTSMAALAERIPVETAPLIATEEQIEIVEDLSDILDDVASDNLGYTLAAGHANTRIRKAVMDGQTNGHYYGILSPIAQNAIRIMRDKLLRPEIYAQYEEELRVLLADITEDILAVRRLRERKKSRLS